MLLTLEGPPLVVLTETLTGPLPVVLVGTVTVSEVSLVTFTPVPPLDPKFTVVWPATNPLPPRVTALPPPWGPLLGLTLVTVGGPT